MALVGLANVTQTQLWPQRDARDPLGVWGGLSVVTGDVSGAPITLFIQASSEIRAAYVYNIVSCGFQKVAGTAGAFSIRRRIITHWPDINLDPGIVAFEDIIVGITRGVDGIGDPETAGDRPWIVSPEDKMLIFDPRSSPNNMTIVEFAINDNENTITYRAQAYGYFWDRSVMETPGGPRFPGSS